jgi:hypothetical protein
MKLDQAVGILTRPELLMQHARRPHKLAVQVYDPGRIGGTPCSEVTGIHVGFDWNAGTVLISTQEPLTRLSAEDVEAIRKSVSLGQSWHAYEAYKVQKAKEDALVTEVTTLKALLLKAQTNLTGMAGALKDMDEYNDLEGELETVSDLVDRIEDTLNPEEVEPDE